MKKILFSVMLLAAVAGLQAQKTISDPNVQSRDAKGFTSIKISSAFDVYISQGNEEALAVSASEKDYLEYIKTEVTGGTLRIWVDGGGMRKFNTGKMKLKAYISFKDLNKLDVSGACDIYIEGTLKLQDLKLVLSGASDLRGKMDMQKLDVDISGASDMTLSGTVGQLKIESSGASNFKGFDLVSEYCDAKASGASDIKITVNKELNVNASGASDIDYKGQGLIRDLKTSGASSVSRKS
ncbi:MAG: head GIN domain-containing protein [Chitinophagaceae bacterium]